MSIKNKKISKFSLIELKEEKLKSNGYRKGYFLFGKIPVFVYEEEIKLNYDRKNIL